jgi:hypothetical protein
VPQGKLAWHAPEVTGWPTPDGTLQPVPIFLAVHAPLVQNLPMPLLDQTGTGKPMNTQFGLPTNLPARPCTLAGPGMTQCAQPGGLNNIQPGLQAPSWFPLAVCDLCGLGSDTHL